MINLLIWLSLTLWIKYLKSYYLPYPSLIKIELKDYLLFISIYNKINDWSKVKINLIKARPIN